MTGTYSLCAGHMSLQNACLPAQQFRLDFNESRRLISGSVAMCV